MLLSLIIKLDRRNYPPADFSTYKIYNLESQNLENLIIIVFIYLKGN